MTAAVWVAIVIAVLAGLIFFCAYFVCESIEAALDVEGEAE